MKKLAGFIIACCLVIIGGSFTAHIMLDQKSIRQHVVHALKEQTGLDLQMEQAEFEILPWPSFHAQSIRLARPHCAAFMTAQSVHADLSLLKLFRREFSFQDFTAEGVWISFHKPSHDEVAQEGICSSWLPFSLENSATSSLEAGAQKTWHVGDSVEANWKISFEALHLGHSHVFWQNAENNQNAFEDNALTKKLREGALEVESLDLEGLRTQNPWINLHAHYDGTPVEIKGHIGHLTRIFRLSHADEQPWYFSIGMIWGENAQKGNVMLDGSFDEPSLLEGGKFSVQGHWSQIDQNALLSEVFFPTLSDYSVSNVQAVVSLEDRRIRQKLSQDDKKQLYDNVHVQELLKEFRASLSPKMFHLQAEHGAIKSLSNVAFSDILFDGAGEKLPVLGQGNISLGHYQWYGRFHFASLDGLFSLFMPQEEGKSADKVAFTATIEGRKNDLNTLSLFQKKPIEEEPVIERDVMLNLQGALGSSQAHSHIQGEAEDINFPLGQKSAFSSPHLHHASLEADLELGFDKKYVSFSHFNLKSDEATISGDGTIEGKFLRSNLAFQDVDMEKLFHISKKLEDNKEPSLENIPHSKEDKRDAKEEFNHLMKKVKNILHDWQWDIILNGNNIYNETVIYNDILFHSSLAGGGLQNSLSGSWQKKEDQNASKSHQEHYPLGATMSIIPVDGDNLRLSLASDVNNGSIFLPFSWVELLFGGDGNARGLIQIIGSLSAEGTDWAGVKQSLNGDVGIAIVNGEIEKSLLTPFLGEASSLLKLGTGTEKLRCLVGHSQIEEGKMSVDKIILQAGKLSLFAHGTASLGDNKMDMVFVPSLNVIGQKITAPLHIEGSFSHPEMSLSHDMSTTPFKKNDEGKGEGDICLEPLHEVRSGAIGPDLEPLKTSSSVGTILHSLGL